MNRCGSSGGGGAAHEVEPKHCLLAGVDFLGAIVVDFGYRYANTTKKKIEEEGGPKVVWRENVKVVRVFIGLKIFADTHRRRALRISEARLLMSI